MQVNHNSFGRSAIEPALRDSSTNTKKVVELARNLYALRDSGNVSTYSNMSTRRSRCLSFCCALAAMASRIFSLLLRLSTGSFVAACVEVSGIAACVVLAVRLLSDILFP